MIEQNIKAGIKGPQGISLAVTDLRFPSQSFDSSLPCCMPKGTKTLTWCEVARLPTGSIIVVVENGQNFLAKLSRGPHPHSALLTDETEDIELTLSNGRTIDYNDLACYTVGQKFRSISAEELALWQAGVP